MRIGVATVKGLARGADKPCLGVSTLEAMAWGARALGGDLCCVMDARAGHIKNGIFFSYLSSEGFGNAATQGAFFSLIGGIIISVMIACTVFLIYHIMVWKKAYDLFDFTFKNKYVLHAVSEVPGFTDLKFMDANHLILFTAMG